MDKKQSVPNILRAGAKTYEERNPLYGDNYKRIGAVMQVLFPQGIPPMDAAGHNRFGCWYMAFNKLIRYAMQMPQGHRDSAHDAMVYAAMLEELTEEPVVVITLGDLAEQPPGEIIRSFLKDGCGWPGPCQCNLCQKKP